MELETQELKETAEMLKNNGMDVYLTKWPHKTNETATYFHFTDGKNIGYCQKEWGGVAFSTIHKPKKGQGSGASAHEETTHVYDYTIESAKRAFYTPGWFINKYGTPTKYTDWEEFADKNKQEYIKY